MTTRRPKGYVGKNHETIGSDILSVLHMLKLPAQVLGEAEAAKLMAVEPGAWYPIGWLIDLMDHIDAQIGHYGLVRLGRTIFKQSHEAKALETLRSARDVIYALDDMYHNANRGGDIGGWRVLEFEPGFAELEKTTPHHCVMEQGILSAAFAAVGCPVTVTQRQCFRDGADCCIYVLTSPVTDARWSGGGAPPAGKR
jgi:hypothetical protein